MANTKIVNGAQVTEIPLDPTKTNDQLGRESHEYSVGKVKTFQGREGHGLNAVLLRGKTVVATILDEGNGGMVWFDWADRSHGESAEEAMFRAFIEGRMTEKPAEKADDGLSPETKKQFAMEEWVNATVDRMLNEKKFKRLCKASLVFQIGEAIGGDEFQVIKGLQHRAYVEKKYAGQKLRFVNDEYKA